MWNTVSSFFRGDEENEESNRNNRIDRVAMH